MRTNAKALFIVCLLALLATSGWRGYVEYAALRDARTAAAEGEAPAKLPDFPAYAGLGLLEYVEAQARTNSLALPVDLFRPSLDAMVSNLVDAILNDPALVVPVEGAADGGGAGGTAGGGTAAGGAAGNLFEVDPKGGGGGAGGGAGRPPRTAPPPRLTYHGVFKRTDDQVAAWITEAHSRTTRFYREGDELFGAQVAGVTVDAVQVRLSDGTVQELPRGETLTLPAPEGAPEPPPQAAAAPAPRREADRPEGRRREGGGLFRRGGAQRLPTAEELAAIERANPEQARRIREAIRRRQERNRPGGANR